MRELALASKINWQLVFGRMLREKLVRLERFKRIVDKSELTEKGAEELADKVNTSLAKRYEKLLKSRE